MDPKSTANANAQPHSAGENWRDALGVTASVACAVHCAAMPFVLGALPALGLSWLADGLFHQLMFVVCLGLAVAAFIPGVLRHRNWTPIAIGGLGILIIGGAAFGLEGSCCAGHAVPAAAAEVSVAACADSCCASPPSAVASEPPVEPLANAEHPQVASLLGPFVPWVTPLGGMLLIAAHLMNRRDLCRCC